MVSRSQLWHICILSADRSVLLLLPFQPTVQFVDLCYDVLLRKLYGIPWAQTFALLTAGSGYVDLMHNHSKRWHYRRRVSIRKILECRFTHTHSSKRGNKRVMLNLADCVTCIIVLTLLAFVV